MSTSETKVSDSVLPEGAGTSLSANATRFKADKYVNSPTGEGTGSFISLEPRRRKTHSKTTASLLASRALFAQCLEELERIIGVPEDLVLQQNALSRIQNTLDAAWKRRADYEDAFAEIVNMMQVSLYGRTLSDLSENQLESLRSAFVMTANTDAFDDQFADDVTTELLRGGINVFRELE